MKTENENQNNQQSNTIKANEVVDLILAHTMNSCKSENKKLLILDVDDVILQTNQAVVDIINIYELYKDKPITIEDIKDWNYIGVRRKLKEKYQDIKNIYKIFESIDFQNLVKFNTDYLKLITNKKILDNYKIMYLTIGTEDTNSFKLNKIREVSSMIQEDNIFFIGLPPKITKDFVFNRMKKKEFKAFYKNSIYVDDKYDNLNHIGLNILLKNLKDTEYNFVKDIREDLYIVNDFKEIIQIVDFFKDFKNINKI